MVQAYAPQLLNQQESENESYGTIMPAGMGNKMMAATQRLVSALEKLERNLQYVELAPPQDEQLTFFANENASLKQERHNLDTAISQLKGQYKDLHQVASTIYGKLDDSIKRLTEIIES
jgi:uncharacterized coiled-coil DUF342 family protein